MKLTYPIRRSILARLRRLRSGPVPSLEFPQDTWDRQYAAGQWDYMAGLVEFGRYAVIAGYVRNLLELPAVLEVGCGTGILQGYLEDTGYARYTGVDISARAIEAASAKADDRTSFHAADGRSFTDGHSYDVVIFNESLYYFDDCIAVLEHYRKALKDDGWFVISMVTGPQSAAHWETMERHFTIADGVRTINRLGNVWDCKIIRARDLHGPRVLD